MNTINSNTHHTTHTVQPTLTLQPLVYEAVQEGATMVTECRAGVGMEPEPVLGLVSLKLGRTVGTIYSTTNTMLVLLTSESAPLSTPGHTNVTNS